MWRCVWMIVRGCINASNVREIFSPFRRYTCHIKPFEQNSDSAFLQFMPICHNALRLNAGIPEISSASIGRKKRSIGPRVVGTQPEDGNLQLLSTPTMEASYPGGTPDFIGGGGASLSFFHLSFVASETQPVTESVNKMAINTVMSFFIRFISVQNIEDLIV